jgi:DNA-binding NtrC family response regulator
MKHPEVPILMVDDEPDILASYAMVLRQSGLDNLLLCNESRNALGLLAAGKICMVLLDLVMPRIDGITLLKQMQEHHPQIPVVVVTSTNDVATAVECMKLGAYDFIVKPVDNVRLSSCVQRALDVFYLQSEVERLKGKVFSQNLNHPEAFDAIITSDSSMHAIFQYVEAIADSIKPVLITGESGVGKDLIARVVHSLGNREGEFVSVNVGGLDDTAFSDALFGHKKGAFTGAHDSRKGLVLKADHGTLFLDEIGELENSSQVKLLQLLQNNEYYPLGSDILKKSSAKIIAATNQKLELRIKEGKFRNDLYYRLSTHRIHIPPLRERGRDVSLLANHFIEKAIEELDRPRPEVTERILAILQAYRFPGNVRELESIIYNAVSLLPVADFEKSIVKAISDNCAAEGTSVFNGEGGGLKEDSMISYTGRIPTLRETEQFLIREAMDKAGGNQTLASQILGISQSTLSRRFSMDKKTDNPMQNE